MVTRTGYRVQVDLALTRTLEGQGPTLPTLTLTPTFRGSLKGCFCLNFCFIGLDKKSINLILTNRRTPTKILFITFLSL